MKMDILVHYKILLMLDKKPQGGYVAE